MSMDVRNDRSQAPLPEIRSTSSDAARGQAEAPSSFSIPNFPNRGQFRSEDAKFFDPKPPGFGANRGIAGRRKPSRWTPFEQAGITARDSSLIGRGLRSVLGNPTLFCPAVPCPLSEVKLFAVRTRSGVLLSAGAGGILRTLDL